jgi:hypothetical protein
MQYKPISLVTDALPTVFANAQAIFIAGGSEAAAQKTGTL